MGGGKGGGSVSTYYGDVAAVVCMGPVDELLAVVIDGAVMWPTNNVWNDGIYDLQVVSVQRLNNQAILRFAVPHTCTTKDKFTVTGLPMLSPGHDFNEAAPTAIASNNDLALAYANAGPNVAETAVDTGLFNKVDYYQVGDLANYAGTTYQCILAHWAAVADVPPNATYWEVYSAKRLSSPNPFPFVVAPSGLPRYGQAYFYWGTDDQVLDTVGEQTLAQLGHPPYRNQAVLVVKQFLLGQYTPTAPNLEVIVTRTPQQTLIIGAAAELDPDNQANPLACLAEWWANPIWGLGKTTPALDETTWRDTASDLLAAAASYYLSPIVDKADSGRTFLANMLDYYDGWLRFNGSGDIEAGHFLHNAAPPAFTAATTIDYTDCIEEIEWDADGWNASFGETVCKFQDLARAYKDAARMYMSLLNLQVTGEPRRATLDRPWITREDQAAAIAAEWGKINAQPALSGSLTVRAEKTAAIDAGDLFLLTHTALEFSVVCRCTQKILAEPPAGRATLKFSNERGIAPVPYTLALPSAPAVALLAGNRVALPDHPASPSIEWQPRQSIGADRTHQQPHPANQRLAAQPRW